MATIRKKWTGRESHALREAMRLSQRDFANELGISAKSISNWESGGAEFVQRPESQAILDTKLRQVSDEVRARFELILASVPTDHAEPETDEKVTGGEDSGHHSGEGSEIEPTRASKNLLRIVTAYSAVPEKVNSAVIDGPTLSAVPPDLPDVPISVLVQASTADAAKITVSAGREIIDSLAIEQFFEEVRRLAVLYNASTAGIDHLVLERSTELRRILQELTTAYRDPSQSADLYLMIGLLSAICSQACLDLGYPDEAMTQARASFVMGDLVGHDGLRAWILGTRSLIARFQGRYDEALSYARRGLQYATSGTALVRLRCGEGQTLAHMGDAANAIDALNLAKDAREHVNSTDVVDGLFTFSEAKQTYYSGSSLQWLSGGKNAKAAETESMRAIRMFREADPGNRSGDELLAHVYVGNSRLTLGEIEGSIEALRPVLDLPVPERNAWERKRMREIASRLDKASFSDSRFAISAREEIASFTEFPGQ
jgi:transcriptional regulator with XRE-family HTH domain/tetratricopeptide (TPR) repeat protein